MVHKSAGATVTLGDHKGVMSVGGTADVSLLLGVYVRM